MSKVYYGHQKQNLKYLVVILESIQIQFESRFQIVEHAILHLDLERFDSHIFELGSSSLAEPYWLNYRRIGRKWNPEIWKHFKT